jgi:hypothetical protein
MQLLAIQADHDEHRDHAFPAETEEIFGRMDRGFGHLNARFGYRHEA